MRPHLATVQIRFVVHDSLRKRNEKHRMHGLLWKRVFRVSNHADDPESPCFGGKLQAEMPVEWVFLREEPLDKSLIHDSNRGGSACIRFSEAASPNNTLTDRFEVAGAHTIPRCAPAFLETDAWVTLHDNAVAPVVHKRIVECEARPLDTRQMRETFLEIAIERSQPLGSISGGWRVQIYRDPMSRFKSEVLVLKVH